jgi:hypothetical protein
MGCVENQTLINEETSTRFSDFSPARLPNSVRPRMIIYRYIYSYAICCIFPHTPKLGIHGHHRYWPFYRPILWTASLLYDQTAWLLYHFPSLCAAVMQKAVIKNCSNSPPPRPSMLLPQSGQIFGACLSFEP